MYKRQRQIALIGLGLIQLRANYRRVVWVILKTVKLKKLMVHLIAQWQFQPLRPMPALFLRVALCAMLKMGHHQNGYRNV